jgi:hypothetical protein
MTTFQTDREGAIIIVRSTQVRDQLWKHCLQSQGRAA